MPWRSLGERYSSYSFLTLALDEGEWSASRPGHTLSPRERTTGQEDGWASEQVWTQRLEEKSFRLCQGLNLDCPVVQSVARHYTDWANLAPPCLHFYQIESWKKCFWFSPLAFVCFFRVLGSWPSDSTFKLDGQGFWIGSPSPMLNHVTLGRDP
jgi:hypothetical protein